MNAEIIAVGSELLTPFRTDTNSLYLTEQLNQLGVEVIFKSIVGDDLAHLIAAAQHSLFRSEIVIFSGGLGPTEDDLTREAVSEALGAPLRRDENQKSSLDYYTYHPPLQLMASKHILKSQLLNMIRYMANGNVGLPVVNSSIGTLRG